MEKHTIKNLNNFFTGKHEDYEYNLTLFFFFESKKSGKIMHWCEKSKQNMSWTWRKILYEELNI